MVKFIIDPGDTFNRTLPDRLDAARYGPRDLRNHRQQLCPRVVTLILSIRRGRSIDGPSSYTLAAEDLVVGSAPEAGWRLDGTVARHCQFGHRGGRWLVVDLSGGTGSGRGTGVNGQPLDRPAAICPGDVIAVGACELLVGTPGPGPARVTDPLLAAAGLTRAQVTGSDADLIAAAGTLMRLLVDGLVAQIADRARAKADLGAEATMLAIGRLNPLKALPADRALAALLAPSAGMMPASEAVSEAFADLTAHQAATLSGMQAALAATLDRFSPAAIRARAQGGGLMARVLPGSREAALWQAYEREFDGVVKGSSDAFVDLFAREFAQAYLAASAGGPVKT